MWLVYWFFFSTPTSLLLQKLSCTVTFLWHGTLTPTTSDANLLWFAGPWAVKVTQHCPSLCVLTTEGRDTHDGFRSYGHNSDVFCLCGFLVPPADWRRSLSRWILPVKVSPRLWFQPRPSTRLHHLLPRQLLSSPCRKTTPPTPSAAVPAVANWREATP